MTEPVQALPMGSYALRGPSHDGLGRIGHHTPVGWGMPAEWERKAACAGTPLELWFGAGSDALDGSKSPMRTPQQTLAAKAICSTCPVPVCQADVRHLQ
jgi:hypothetical protein